VVKVQQKQAALKMKLFKKSGIFEQLIIR